MVAITGWKRLALGLGMALGLAVTANAQTYTGSYIGGDRGNITIHIDPNGGVSCSLQSTAGNGAVTGFGKVVEPIPNRLFMCDNFGSPDVLTLSGGYHPQDSDMMVGKYVWATGSSNGSKYGTFTTRISNVDGDATTTVLSPQAISGLWYDPAYNGVGFNFLVADNGFFATYYGRSIDGGLLWLITTEVPTGTLKTGFRYRMVLGHTTAGTFSTPEFELADWGTLEVTFSSCTRATATLFGKDGAQQLNLQRLGAIAGVSGC